MTLPDRSGRPVLHSAIEHEPSLAPVIVKSNSGKEAVNIPNKLGDYPLHSAVERCKYDLVRLLLDNGAGIDNKNKNMKTALILACRIFHKERSISKLLIDRGAQVNVADEDMETPLHIAVSLLRRDSTYLHAALELTSSLLEKGASPNARDLDGMTPLQYAVEDSSIELVEVLLRNGADVNTKNELGETPLFTVRSSIDILALLLQMGADINAQDDGGRTPLHHLCDYYRIFLHSRDDSKFLDADNKVNIFLDWGASVDVKDNSGNKPFKKSKKSFVRNKKLFDIRKTCVNFSQKPAKDFVHMDEFGKHEIACWEELDKMKVKRLGDHFLYDIFRQRNLPRFLFNKELEKAVNSKDFKKQFPIYDCLLKSTYHKAKQRMGLMDAVVDTLLTPLPVEIMECILTFVDDENLRSVLEAKKELG